MQDITVDEAKDQLAALVQAAVSGDEVVIRENGHAVKLVPVPKTEARPCFGSAKGIVLYMAEDFDAPLEDFKEYME
ncbi:MAG TPA: DUF2281 domain-containing protein [Abditibacteriaceae bacterium]|jgi:prevent-host-death family protein